MSLALILAKSFVKNFSEPVMVSKLEPSHWLKDKGRQAKFLLPGWRLRLRLGPHKDKARWNTPSVRRSHLAGHPAPETILPARSKTPITDAMATNT